MQVYSKLLNRTYNAENVVYIVNMLQVSRYMKNGAHVDLVDILYDGVKRNDTLVFVFEKTQLIKELYRKWNAHELN
jgi:hypothetical protein